MQTLPLSLTKLTNLDFDKEEKSITLFIQSSLENNSLEISFPNTLIGGDYTILDFFEIRDVIDFDISDGYVDDIEGNQSTNSLIFTLFEPGDDGTLSVQLSDDVITPFDDGSFIVLIDDVESDYIIENDNIIINFDSNSQQITLIGTYVVPEFYEKKIIRLIIFVP